MKIEMLKQFLVTRNNQEGDKMKQPEMLMFTPVMPWQHDAVLLYTFGPVLTPFEYTGWRRETLSWKDSAYLGTVLSFSPIYVVKGPEAEKFLSDTCVNNILSMKVGSMRHGVMCNEQGLIMTEGIIIKTAENEFLTAWMHPYIEYVFAQRKYNAEGIDLTGKYVIFQVAGPRSLEILETASGDDLHDIKFARHRTSKIAGKDVRILRLGMAGTLAYEVHCDIEVAAEVYEVIWNAGQSYEMKKLGLQAYMMNHTEDGFSQAMYHFLYAWETDLGMKAFLEARPNVAWNVRNPNLVGSLGQSMEKRYVTPFDVGYDKIVKFDHEFIGRRALEKIAANPPRTVVTLEWNAEDVMDVYGSQLRGTEEEPYYPIADRPNDAYYQVGSYTYHTDYVYVDGKEIGISAGRALSQLYKRMISLAFIDRKYTGLGTEVEVLWGTPGTRQKRIRAKVARFPYLQMERNEVIDVETIPRGRK